MSRRPLTPTLFLVMVRRAEPHAIKLQLVSDSPLTLRAHLAEKECICEVEQIQLGEKLFFYACVLKPQQGQFASDTPLGYRLFDRQTELDLTPFCYPNQPCPQVVIPKKLSHVLHGSCRNPHHYSDDSLAVAAKRCTLARQHQQQEPQLLLLSGDQIYADDVAGAMLQAIYQLIEKLGIYRESEQLIPLPSALSEQLYQRHHLLPKTPWQQRSKWQLGYWLKKDVPHFSSVKSANHLIRFEEFIALYLLNLSAQIWQLIDFDALAISPQHPQAKTFYQEKQHLQRFKATQKEAQQLFANISTLMIFDDHDVTDDWNLTAGWEQAVYEHPASRRIISNALLSYALFQGWGNVPEQTPFPFIAQLQQAASEKKWQLDELERPALDYHLWHYQLDTFPKIVVLDTRTHRWRNEQNFNEPSGLLDWEHLLELERNLLSHNHVIIVSPAPVFGVKSIEAIQAIFNLCGEPLMVDVENWMAHEGSAKKLLDTFRRPDTPDETIILSGDVHYSFCFSVKARFSERDNRIWQLTASGIKNEFPRKLINALDKLDSLLYKPYSPLNLFTKRWQMRVNKHDTTTGPQKHLVSHAAISLITLEEGHLQRYQLLHDDGSQTEFDLELD